MSSASAPLLSFTRVVSSRYQVESCAFSPDGVFLATCLSDGSARLYTVKQQTDAGREVGGADPAAPKAQLKLDRIFRQHRSNVWCVAFSKDSKLLCSCSSDKTVMLYSVTNLSLQTIFCCFHTDTIWCCCFSEIQNSTVIASGSSDCTVAIYKAATGQNLHRLTGFQGAVDMLSFSADGERLCTGSRDYKVRVWFNLSPGMQPSCLVLSNEEQPVRVCRFSPHNVNVLITSAGMDHSLHMWELWSHSEAPSNDEELLEALSSSPLQPVTTFSGHCNIVWDCCFFSQRQKPMLVTCSGDRTVRLVRTSVCVK